MSGGGRMLLLPGASRGSSPVPSLSRWARSSLPCCCWPGGRRRLPLAFLLVLAFAALTWVSLGRVGGGRGGNQFLPLLPAAITGGEETPARTFLAPHKEDFCPSVPPVEAGQTMAEALRPAGKRGKTVFRVLIVPKTPYSDAFKAVTELLVANRIKFKTSVAGKNLPDLLGVSPGGVGKYAAVFFEDFRTFLQMDPKSRDALAAYCKDQEVGLISLVPADDLTFVGGQTLRDEAAGTVLPLTLGTRAALQDLAVNASSTMLRLVRGGQTEPGHVRSSPDWVTLEPGHPTYSGVAWAEAVSKDGAEGPDRKEYLVLQDHGLLDSLPKVLFGGRLRHWLNKLLFLDALSWASGGKIAVPLERYVLVDVDDVFVGKHRFLPADVEAMLASQRRLAEQVPGFRYNLGFSGGYFGKGPSLEEVAADELLLRLKDEFWWFPHMWLHYQPHNFDNATELAAQMEKNRRFAREKGLPTGNDYAVAPHHSGVYPVHEQLYVAWRDVWGIRVTSTEEYPHLRPARLRRGFVHSGVSVLPRQTCGLFTKNLFYSEYPGGPSVLEDSIRGGELFQTIVNNPVSVFMTHMPNYVEDRLAPYAFESVVRMLRCWTNLRLRSAPPPELARAYFGSLHPEEAGPPVWSDPCEDRRHAEIWSSSKRCGRLPKLLVVGPQKTGTTALYRFLKMHPSVRSNEPSEESFEELQFFSGQTYAKGVDWYMDHFPLPDESEELDNSTVFFFEKSATYFDHDLAPNRAHRLVAGAHIVAILTSPARRAYSWYQHMRAHEDPVAMSHTIQEVLAAGPDSPRPLRQLQSRCLEPGKYASHLERWLLHFRPRQVHLVDGDELVRDPAAVLNRLQRELGISPFVDYRKRLRFDKRKGFYCEVVPDTGRTKCLGRGKGRKYPPLPAEAERTLRAYYRPHNQALSKLLGRLQFDLPGWLAEEMEDGGEKET